MAQELYANDASTTVAAAAGAPGSGTPETWIVASSASFPSASNVASPPTQFHVADPAAPSELILVTNVAGTTWMVTRGAESTIPVPHSAGYTIAQVLTAGDLTALATYSGDLSLVSGVTEVTSTSLVAPLPVTQGGIGAASLTTYGVLAGGTASTTAVQQIPAGTSGQVLTGNGAGTLPSFQANVGFTNPMSALGDMIYGGTSPTAGAATRLTGGTVAAKQFLTQTGTGSTSAAPAWGTIASTDVGGVFAITQGGTGAGGSVAALANLGAMPLTGGTFSGTVTLAADPAAALQPATRQYVDSQVFDTPGRRGFISYTFSPSQVTVDEASTLLIPSGDIALTKIWVEEAATVTNIVLAIGNTVGGTLTTNQNFAGIYDHTGARQAVTADQAAAWSTTGNKNTALTMPVNGGTAISLSAGFYWVTLLINGTTGPSLCYAFGQNSWGCNFGLTPATCYSGFLSGSFGSLPTSFTPSSIFDTHSSAFPFLAAFT